MEAVETSSDSETPDSFAFETTRYYNPIARLLGVAAVLFMCWASAKTYMPGWQEQGVLALWFPNLVAFIIIWLTARILVTSVVRIEPDRIFVRNVFRNYSIRRDEVIDFGHAEWGGATYHPDEPAVVIVQSEGWVVGPVAIVEDIFPRPGRERLPARLSRALVAWYLQKPEDDPTVNQALHRTGTISGRYVFTRKKHQRFGGMITFILVLLTWPIFIVAFGITDPRIWRHAWEVALTIACCLFYVWLVIDILRPRIILMDRYVDVLNPFSRRRRVMRDDVTDIATGKQLELILRDGTHVPLYIGKKRAWQRSLKWQQGIVDDLERWMNPPWADAAAHDHHYGTITASGIKPRKKKKMPPGTKANKGARHRRQPAS